jgi:eukaryotic-like serine/threonine-protein kinase
MPVCPTCGTTYGSTVRICVHDGTPLATDRTDDRYLGTLLDGKYRIDAFINAGGMGSLYRALHVMLDKTVAVKVIKNELVTSDEVVARFQREARAASNLHHPNIVSVYDLGQTPDGTLYIAMEFIDGPSLKEVIRRDGPLTPRESIDILRQVASALSSAHRKQIVHRDLKSDNLMLATEDGRTVVKLVDFGIAKTFDDSTQLTAAGYMLGTPNYMSPEQAAGNPVDHRTDLYSLGVILFEMLTGKVPFGDAAMTSLLVRLATEVPPPPSARRPDGRVPLALDAVAMRCLEKDPERRFQSASEFADALERASADIDTQPTMPHPSMPAGEPTLVRPAEVRQIGTPPPNRGQRLPAADLRTGLDMTGLTKRIAAALVVLVAAAAAVVTGIRLFSNPQQETRASATSQQPVPSSVPAPPRPSAQVPAAAVPEQAPAASETSISTNPAPVGASASTDGGRGRVPSQNASPLKSPAPSVGPPPAALTTPRSQASVDHAPTAVAPVTAPAPAAAPGQAGRSGPSATVTCQGYPDVCEAIRSEIVKAFRVNTSIADIEIAVKVRRVSERLSTQFAAPRSIPTYSVELTGNSVGTALVMPTLRPFEVDPLFASQTLPEHARQIASEAVATVRAFTAGRN